MWSWHQHRKLICYRSNFSMNIKLKAVFKTLGGKKRSLLELWEVSHSEGDAEHSPLRSRRAQRASLGTTVHRVSRWLALGISKSPSWPQSVLYISGILTVTVQFPYFPDCTVLTFTRRVWPQQQEFQVWSASAWWAQLTALVMPATCSCSTSTNTVLAGSRFARYEGVGCTTTDAHSNFWSTYWSWWNLHMADIYLATH